jgi:DNA integrity scanning protein DisA with diadenylate cyclase activity/mannitol/fructose-specific phosphotransferase system IIA component (Ntr-type)
VKSSPRTKSPKPEQRLSQLIHTDAVVDLSVDSKEGLLRTLAEVVVDGASKKLVKKIYECIEERESQVNTYVHNGVAIPNARVEGVDGLRIALARNPEGFPYGIDTDEPVTIAILVIGDESSRDELVGQLGSIASLFKDPALRDRVLEAPDAAAVLRVLDSSSAESRPPRSRPRSQLLLSHARKLAKEVGATAVVVVIENKAELKILKRIPRRGIFIVATSSRSLAEQAEPVVKRVLRLPRLPLHRDALVRIAALLALTRGLIERGDLVAFLSGHDRDQLDTMTFVETGREFRRFVIRSGQLSRGVRPEVLERTIALTAELSAQGREGSAVGTCFVLVGDIERLADKTQQMVMNPFRGYPDEERNILDPTLAETIKEFASIDGAFIIRGDGVVLSAGTYLSADEDVELAGGYGSRHRSACAITRAADCVSVTLSQSTGEINVYKQGAVVLNLPRDGSR